MHTPDTGTFGNIRTFTASNGAQVKVSAYSRSTSGVWETAYLGSYSPGLGVTSQGETVGSPGHKTDNKGKVEYVLFEFSAPVVVNKVLLDYIGDDGDMTVWIGNRTDPFNNHLSTPANLLNGLTVTEDNMQDASVTSRTADINAPGVSGNVLVVAAWPDDENPEDEFKIKQLLVECFTPPPTCTGIIGDYVWKDLNGNGIQDSGEPGISGRTVQLKNGSTVIATTTTDANGKYQFTGICAGTYTVVTSTPTDYTPSPSNAGTNRAVDSNGSAATVTLSANNSSDLTIDFGFVPTPAPICVSGSFTFSGSTSTTGAAANIRSFTATNGIKVKVSAFSRSDTGSWTTAYLGLYSSGFGVTNVNEDGTDPGHRVDNRGSQTDYVLFEFDSPIVVDKAVLEYLGADSDISVWIGNKTNPYLNHINLSDSMLSSLVFHEDNKQYGSGSRTADINAGNVSGNVLVISAWDTNNDGDDEFKLKGLHINCPTTPPPTCTGSIGNLVWKDVNNNGIQDTGEPGLANITVTLKNGSTVIATTTTNSTGNYQFTGLCAGTYTVVVATPTGYNASPSNVGTNRGVDSNGSAATVTLSTSSTSDQTIDFGFAPPPPPPVCQPVTFTLTGDTAVTGSAGNIRTFTGSNGVQVKASAFSRKSDGTWQTAYLGAYSTGLGVTATNEDGSYGSHKVDNMGRVEYVLLEFASPVAINHIKLDSIGDDSDISVWIGNKTNPFSNHITLSDSVITSLGAVEENATDESLTARTADVNGDLTMGNVVVISALASDTSPEDEFKIRHLIADCVETGGYVTYTYTQGGWGATPSGTNPGALLQAKFSSVYSTGKVQIGGLKKLTFTSAAAIAAFLPQGGTASKLTADATNPTSTSAGVLAGQVLALQLSVDFSNKGFLPAGLGSLKVASGDLAGQTVTQVLATANAVLGGAALPSGLTYSELNAVVDAINNNFDNGSQNLGFLTK